MLSLTRTLPIVLLATGIQSYATENSGAFTGLTDSPSNNLYGDLTIQTSDATGSPLIDAQFFFRLDGATPNYGMVLSKGTPNVFSHKHISNDTGRWTWLVNHSFQYPSPAIEDRPVMSLDVTSTISNLSIYAPPGTYPVSAAPYKVASSLSSEGLKVFRLNGYYPSTNPESELTADGVKLYRRDYNSSTAIIELEPANGLTIRNPSGYSGTPVRLQSTGLDLAGGSLTGVSSISGSLTNMSLATRFTVGTPSGATGNKSLYVGDYVGGTANNSASIGSLVTVTGPNSLAVGSSLTASGFNSFVAGENNSAPAGYSAVFGRYAITPTGNSVTSFIATDDLFVIGNGTSSARANAVTIKKGGATAIGNGLATAADAQAQVVVGRYNDSRTTDNNGVDHTAGVFIIGAGANTANRLNAIRVLADGTVLVKPSGDLDMGGFTSGQTP